MGGQTEGPKSAAPSVGYGWVWPGLAPLWTGGEWSGLGWAVGFGLALNGLVVATFVYDDWLGSTTAWCAWIGVAVFWILGATTNRRWLKRFAKRRAGELPTADLYPEAFHEYLQGNWFVAETKCRELIRVNRDDAEARLLLATLLRHVDRLVEARKELDVLARQDAGTKWRLEIAQERKLLDEATLAPNNSDVAEPEGSDGDTTDGEEPEDRSATRMAP